MKNSKAAHATRHEHEAGKRRARRAPLSPEAQAEVDAFREINRDAARHVARTIQTYVRPR